jgi:hypothetical protein
MGRIQNESIPPWTKHYCGFKIRISSAEAQLEVENPAPLRTICIFDFRERLVAAGQCFFTRKL